MVWKPSDVHVKSTTFCCPKKAMQKCRGWNRCDGDTLMGSHLKEGMLAAIRHTVDIHSSEIYGVEVENAYVHFHIPKRK